jgi:hypothetical protein
LASAQRLSANFLLFLMSQKFGKFGKFDPSSAGKS